MHEYPHSTVSQILVANTTWWDLESRLALIFVGASHSSSEVHKMVIGELEAEGPASTRLEALRQTAEKSKNALYAGDLGALGRAMVENTEAQERLHPDLVGPAISAGQVSVASQQAQGTPNDRQATGGVTK